MCDSGIPDNPQIGDKVRATQAGKKCSGAIARIDGAGAPETRTVTLTQDNGVISTIAVASDLEWLGCVLPPLIYWIGGQSNAEGRASTAYAPTVHYAWFYGHDGTIHDLADPVSAGAVFGSYGTTGAAYSLVPTLARRFRELGIDNPLVFVPDGYAGTDSASWALSLATEPPDPNTLIGRAKLRLAAVAALYPDAEFGGLITYQGESDAQTEAESLLHAANWNAVYDELEAYIATLWPWHKDTHILHVIPPPTAPAGYTYWGNMRADASSLASRPHTRTVQAPETVPTGQLHQNTGTDDTTGLRRLAVDLAKSWFDAP